MCESDFDEFVRLLDDAYVFQKDKLTAAAKMVFFRAMSPYALATVRAAMSAHMLDPKVGKWAMQPSDLIAQIQAAGDGRPGVEEAWAIAITSRDEADTVVWTQEIAEAFGVCQPVLDMGDEVGARMAFKDAYNRLVSAARASCKPAQWSASIGWDVTKRAAALTKAANTGLLPGSTVAALLPPPSVAIKVDDAGASAQIAKIKEMMATMGAERRRENELHAQRERDATAEAKRKANEQTANYKRDEAA